LLQTNQQGEIMTIATFEFAPMPHIHFGWGIRHNFVDNLQTQAYSSVVLITGKTIAHPGNFGSEL